ncbi:MAG: PAS domain-containing protein [Acidimicrobiia bacterium]
MATQQPLEMILLRQLASYLAVPMWIMDSLGNLVYYNEPAERLLGVSFDNVGPIDADDLVDTFRITDLDGEALDQAELPIVKSLVERVPAHLTFRFCGMDGVWRKVAVSALPIEGQGDRFLGAFATFWEAGD